MKNTAETIAQMREKLEKASLQERALYLEQYEKDTRKGVQSLVAQYRRRELALCAERERLEKMRFFEKKYAAYTAICGVDEAGRGPLAGPVVAGACILPADVSILYLNDSKKLSAKKRALLYEKITDEAVAYGVGIVSPQRIDELNILQATYEAMQQAIAQLSVVPNLVLADAVTIPKLSMKQVTIVKGDEKSVSIAAASILAKVTRDRMMLEYDKVYPAYGFSHHMGYGTAEHIRAIQAYGACPIHRQTFIGKFLS